MSDRFLLIDTNYKFNLAIQYQFVDRVEEDSTVFPIPGISIKEIPGMVSNSGELFVVVNIFGEEYKESNNIFVLTKFNIALPGNNISVLKSYNKDNELFLPKEFKNNPYTKKLYIHNKKNYIVLDLEKLKEKLFNNLKTE